MPEKLSDQQSQILASLQTIVTQQQDILRRQQSQLDNMQDQLGMLTEVATKLAFMEERRAEDKTHLADLEHRFNLVRDRVNEKFPQYDALTETYTAVNNKLWGAIGAAAIGVLLGAAKLGLFS